MIPVKTDELISGLLSHQSDESANIKTAEVLPQDIQVMDTDTSSEVRAIIDKHKTFYKSSYFITPRTVLKKNFCFPL